jgi:hypothetical protein
VVKPFLGLAHVQYEGSRFSHAQGLPNRDFSRERLACVRGPAQKENPGKDEHGKDPEADPETQPS